MRWLNGLFGRIFLGINKTSWLEEVNYLHIFDLSVSKSLYRPVDDTRIQPNSLFIFLTALLMTSLDVFLCTSLATPRFPTVHYFPHPQKILAPYPSILPFAPRCHLSHVPSPLSRVLPPDAQRPYARRRGFYGGWYQVRRRSSYRDCYRRDDSDAFWWGRRQIPTGDGQACPRCHCQGGRGEPPAQGQASSKLQDLVGVYPGAQNDDRAYLNLCHRLSLSTRLSSIAIWAALTHHH